MSHRSGTPKKSVNFLIAAISLCSASSALASGFQLFEQNASGLGSFHSGGAALADDASTAFYNPAGLTRIHKTELASSALAIFTRAQFSGSGLRSTDISNSPITQFSESGSTSIKAQKTVPAVQMATPISNRTVIGLDISVPFGLATSWDDGSLVRYQGTESAIQTVNISPNIGYRVNNHWSIGGGVDIQRLDAEINMIGGVMNNANADTVSTNELNGFGYGWHFGMLYDVSYATRIGFHHRSRVKHEADGRSQLKDGALADLNTSGGIPNTQTATIKLTLPDTTTLSVFHEMDHTWDLMGSVYFTRWSVIDELKLENAAAPGEKDGLTMALPTNYHDTFSFNIGTNYHPTSKWQLSAGVGYDQSPVDNKHREIRLPDNDRIAVAVGYRYNLSRHLRMDAALAHIMLKDAKIDNTVQSGHQLAQLSGTAKGSADIFGLQMTWTM